MKTDEMSSLFAIVHVPRDCTLWIVIKKKIISDTTVPFTVKCSLF